MRLFFSMLFIILSGTGYANFFEYQSPISGSSYHLQETTLIIRPGYQVSEADLALFQQSSVVGSLSGRHAYQTLLVEEGKTVIFKFDEKFSQSETVHVTFLPEVRSLKPLPVGKSYKFNFSISHNKSLVDASDYSVFNQKEKCTDSIPADFTPMHIDITGNTAPGYLFYSTDEHTLYRNVMLCDNGKPFFYDNDDGFYADFKLQENGLLTHCKVNIFNNMFIARNTEMQLVDTFRMQNGYLTDFHECLLNNNGEALVMSYDQQTVDMSQHVIGGNSNAKVTGMVFQVIDGGDNVLFQWRSWDHYDVTDGIHHNGNEIDYTAPTIHYVHCSAIDWDSEGNFYVSARNMNEVTKIDRNTGDVVWRMGGKHNEFTFLNDSLNGFNAQHDARWHEGSLSMLDNGVLHNPQISRAIEYNVDEINMTATLEWSYPNPYDYVSHVTGNVQKLPNGGVFINWGQTYLAMSLNFSELDANQESVMEVWFQDNSSSIFTYRAFRFPYVITNTINEISAHPNELSIYPNPTSGPLHIQFPQALKTGSIFNIYDNNGKKVLSQPVRKGEQGIFLNINSPSLLPAFYFYELYDGIERYSGKISKL